MSQDEILNKILAQTESQTEALNRHIEYDFKKDEDMMEAIKESTQCMQKLDKKLDLHIQKMTYELANINELDQQQNALLDEHIKRTTIAERRLDALEEPRKYIKTTMKVLLTIGGVTGAIYSIMRFFGG